jgi:hypothetical protein
LEVFRRLLECLEDCEGYSPLDSWRLCCRSTCWAAAAQDSLQRPALDTSDSSVTIDCILLDAPFTFCMCFLKLVLQISPERFSILRTYDGHEWLKFQILMHRTILHFSVRCTVGWHGWEGECRVLWTGWPFLGVEICAIWGTGPRIVHPYWDLAEYALCVFPSTYPPFPAPDLA